MTDDDIDATLRRLGAQWRSTAPDTPSPATFDQTPARAHSRVTTLVAAGIAVAAVTAAVVLVGDVGGGPLRVPVPAATASATPTPTTTPPTTIAPPPTSRATGAPPSPAISAPACTADQLSPSIGRHGPAGGTDYILIVLTNTSTQPCTLGGGVELTGIHPNGTVDNPGFTSSTDPGYAPASPVTGPGPITPGAAGGFVIGEGLNCPSITGTYTTLRIQIANGPTLDMPWDPMFSGCAPIVGPAGPVPPSALQGG